MTDGEPARGFADSRDLGSRAWGRPCSRQARAVAITLFLITSRPVRALGRRPVRPTVPRAVAVAVPRIKATIG